MQKAHQEDVPKVMFSFKETCEVENLMDQYSAVWDESRKEFDFSNQPFDIHQFTRRLSRHFNKFKKERVIEKKHFGYIEKFDLDPYETPQIYMRADLHGDLKSLIENLRTLQEQGLLDSSYKCKPGVHLVFLGDYCDRGKYGTQILEMLICLREENPQQVHLIRGNHEYIELNWRYGSTDSRLTELLEDEEGQLALKSFYETMPLTTYFCVEGNTKREYIQCTHGLFEPSMDPAHLLDNMHSGDYLPVPRKRKLSKRVKIISKGHSSLSKSAKRVSQLMRLECIRTAYNWADVSAGHSRLGELGNRSYTLNAQDIRHYLDLSSTQHRVMMLFRGHQHAFQHLMHEGSVIATTLPVGMDSCVGYQNTFDQPDRAYIIKPATQVKDWKKCAILRKKGHIKTNLVTDPHPLTSSVI